jgi:hypothetical protein
LYDKLTDRLQNQLVIHRYIFNQDVNKLCELVSGVDTKNKRMAKLRAANAAKNLLPFLSKIFIQASTAADKILTIGSRGTTPAFLPTLSITIRGQKSEFYVIIRFSTPPKGAHYNQSKAGVLIILAELLE